MKKINSTPKHFYSLDALRGVAAISVIVWHWQHFFYNGATSAIYNIGAQPFYFIFFPFYHRGYLAVDLFFSLSGFIFFWLYAENINNKQINGLKFFILRFSRLYPLHLLTLLVVLVGQIISKSYTGNFIIFPYNDAYHFILNIFLASHWGLQKGFSFNAPIWTVSVEVLMYFLFFKLSRWGGTRSFIITLIVVFSSFFFYFLIPEIWRVMFSFFIGGCTFILYKKIIKYNLKKIIKVILPITIALWLATFIDIRYNIIASFSNHVPIDLLANIFAAGLLFPITILCLAFIETELGQLGKNYTYLAISVTQFIYGIFLSNFFSRLFLLHLKLKRNFFIL
jgi:peptidoglycan/LPS O-acetylase OafA/YrhL